MINNNCDNCIYFNPDKKIRTGSFSFNDKHVPIYSIKPGYCKLHDGYCRYKKKSWLYKMKEKISKIIAKIFGGSR